MPQMIISRRSYLFSGASQIIMCAAGAASSPEAVRRQAERQAKKQHAELMRRVGA